MHKHHLSHFFTTTKMAPIGKFLLLQLPLASFGLGFWQIRRLEWKKKLIQELEERLSQEPIDLLSLNSLDDLITKEYCRVKVYGYFDPDPSHQIYLKPRQLIVNDDAILRGRSALQTSTGLNVITPFNVEATNLRILINRGWLAEKGRDSIENLENRVIPGAHDESKKPMQVIGIYRKTDNRPRYGQRNDESTNQWQFRDVDAMSRVLRTAPIYLEAESSLTGKVGPIGGQTRLSVRNEHLNYAITWFSLGFFCLALWYGRYGRYKSKILTALAR